MESIIPFPNISRKNAVTFFILIMAAFVFFTIPYIGIQTLFYPNGLSIITSNGPSDFASRTYDITHPVLTTINPGAYILEVALYKIIPNWNILPYLSSIALLITVYLFGLKISNNRVLPLISMSFLAITKTFYWYSMSVTYPNIDALFMIVSLYPFIKMESLKKPVFWAISLYMKGTSLFMFPTLLFSSKNNKKAVIILTVLFAIISIFVFLFHVLGDFSSHKSVNLTSNLLNLTHDYWILPLIPIFLIILWTSRSNHSKLFFIAIINSLLIPVILLYTTVFDIQPYRFILTMSLLAISLNMIIPDLYVKINSLKTRLT